MKLYKYRNIDDSFVENIIKNSSLYFASVDDFNDPFDCKLSYRQSYSKHEIKQFFIDLKKRHPDHPLRLKDMIKKYGKNQDFIELQNQITNEMIDEMSVLSLSSNHDNILMWSHYSKNHTGLVFEFTPKDINDINSCFYLLEKVDYVDSYTELSYTNKQHKEEVPELFLTKYKDWSYEEEYRAFGLDFKGEKQFLKHELTGIIFGVKTTERNIQHIINLCTINNFEHVKFRQAKLVHGRYALSFEEIHSNI